MILAPIYEYLTEQGYKAKGVFVFIEGMPVQLLPVCNPLTEEGGGEDANNNIRWSDDTHHAPRVFSRYNAGYRTLQRLFPNQHIFRAGRG